MSEWCSDGDFGGTTVAFENVALMFACRNTYTTLPT